MNNYLSRLNPAERRFVVAVGLIFFLVINIFWIWPHFSDWGNLNRRMDKANGTLTKYSQAIEQKPKLEAELKKLASEGSYVPPEDHAIQFLRTIQVQAAQSGVGFQGSSRSFNSTNQFFLEQGQTISIVSGEKQLVDFLYNLGSGNSLIRVREISVRPDQARQQLNASITLVASYQKTSKAPVPAAKPAAAPVTKPATAPKPAPAKPATPTPPSKPAAPKAATPNKK
jgi:hypothetical protein